MKICCACSCLRLRQVQALLRDEGNTAPDGILCSLGIDSRYNEGCSELASYLFFDLYKHNQEQIPEDFPEEVLDDVIILIKAESVHLYCNPVNYSYLLPYVSHWRNLHLHCMTETEYEDEEAAEEFKISSFVSMVEDCTCIGIPYSSHSHMQKFDVFMLEKWPIVQAFALEGIGAGGFFTMKYKLIDVSEQLWQIYARLDPVSLDCLLNEVKWTVLPNYPPFRTYYSHGLISSNITDNSRQPFVLFGSHSSKEDLDSHCFTFPSEGHQIRNTGPHGGPAKHMLLQCVAPKGPLACARTYFFGSTHVPYLGKFLIDFFFFCRLLSQIYSAAIQAVLAGIKCFSINSSASKTVFELCLYHCVMVLYDLPQASMVVHDIPDLQWGGDDLGSVVFSESFLESSIYIEDRGEICLLQPHLLLFCFLVEESDVRLFEQALHLLKNGTCLGTPLTTKDSSQVFSSSLLSTPEEGKLVFFSEGLLFISSHYGTITISKNHIKTIKVYDGDSLSTAAVLFIDYESSLLPHLPFHLHSPDHCLAITLMPKTKGYKSFYSLVLQVWNKPDSGLRMQHVAQDQLSLGQKNISASYPYFCIISLSFDLLMRVCVVISRFLKHFAVSSSVCEESVCSDHLTALFPNAHHKPAPSESEQKVVLSIISGLPGSYKESLCDFLVDVNQECGRWEVYSPAMDMEDLCVPHLQRFLSSLVDTQSEMHFNTPRVLLLTPGCTDVLDVVQAIVSHADPRVQSRVSVGTVTACVNPLASFMEHRLLFPKLLEQCSQGVVNNVVFTGLTTDQKHPLLKHMQQLIRSANPKAAFILAERGAVTRTEDMRLILSDRGFSQPQMIRSRYLLYPGWWEGRFVSGCGSVSMSQHYLQFSRPLEKTLFLQHCKGLKSSLRCSPFTGNIYHISGKVLFSDSNRLMEVSCNSVSGSVNLSPDQGSTYSRKTTDSCYLLFHGVGITQEGLKDWLRQCAKQKVTKKVKKTKRTLTPQEIRNIHVKKHLEPLPPGYFYNGHQFVSFFGEKQNFHPLMDQFIEEYIQEANKEIDRFNREVDLYAHTDLFE
uniref:Uncharacterized protein n=1 Tax=Pygocentrus nattereri TaxID=42514 RepID=A0AAR2IGP7_PYGNA